MTAEERKAIFDAFGEPFEIAEVKYKPITVSGNRCLALAYVDARVVMDRLDDVVGMGNWQTSYRELEDGVVCCLRVRIGEEWCQHEDVGSFSDQPDGGDRLKAAFSDSLKRAAVHLGIGRYLYRLPRTWADYDPQKRVIIRTPALPAWAMPRTHKPAPQQQPAVQPPPVQQPVPAAPEIKARTEIEGRAKEFELKLIAQGRCNPDDLVDYLEVQIGENWPWEEVEIVEKWCKVFASTHPKHPEKAGQNGVSK